MTCISETVFSPLPAAKHFYFSGRRWSLAREPRLLLFAQIHVDLGHDEPSRKIGLRKNDRSANQRFDIERSDNIIVI